MFKQEIRQKNQQKKWHVTYHNSSKISKKKIKKIEWNGMECITGLNWH